MARRVLMAEVSGGRVRGRPRLDWMDGVKVALVYLAIFLYFFFLGLFGHFAWHCVSLDRPPQLCWLSPGEGWDRL